MPKAQTFPVFTSSVIAVVRITCRVASSVLLALGCMSTEAQPAGLSRVWASEASHSPETSTGGNAVPVPAPKSGRPLIVIGFMGGNVHPDNLVHREARLTRDLQLGYPVEVHAEIFANRHGQRAFDTVLRLLGDGGDTLSDVQKSSARIVIFGHSWGASEAVALANRLNRIGVPVLLTIQVDSVQKQRQNDAAIPPNVREAVNFYQSEGMLRGRNLIVAADPGKTTILGNFESSYRDNPVSCAGFPWYARAFMKPHVQIENDPAVWQHIEELILAKIL